MKTLSYDTQRTIKALNTNKKVSVTKSGSIFDLEIKRSNVDGETKIILRSRKNPKTGIVKKIWYTEISSTLNELFLTYAIYEIA
jgi:RNase P/RNase MRP subunit p29